MTKVVAPSTRKRRRNNEKAFFLCFMMAVLITMILIWIQICYLSADPAGKEIVEDLISIETKNKGKTQKEKTARIASKITPVSKNPIEPTSEQVKDALRFVDSVRENYSSYETWTKRGIGWLYRHPEIVLTATFNAHPTERGRQEVTIWNVNRSPLDDCARLTIWVRVAGPEMFAGSAKPATKNDGSCYWRFLFNIQVPGEYTVEAKVLLWNGLYSPHEPCQMERDLSHGLPDFLEMPHHSVTGFKLYTPHESCCIICTRTPGCVHWSYPALQVSVEQGCELYYDKDNVVATTTAMNHRRLLQRSPPPPAHGSPLSCRKNVTQFLGCGWSFHLTSDFPCLHPDLDDSVHMISNKIIFLKDESVNKKRYPFCALRDEVRSMGRWIQFDWPDETECPTPFGMDVQYNAHFDVVSHDGENPSCWMREDLQNIGNDCVEACMVRKRTDSWTSVLKKKGRWFGKWQPYHCNYREYTNEQLQRCIRVDKKIGSIRIEGDSIAQFLTQYLNQRLDGMEFSRDKDAIEVMLTTLSFPHLLWNHPNPDEWIDQFRQYRIVRNNQDFYWLSGFYYSSEREPLVHVERANQLNQVILQHLQPKGYKLLEAMDMTAAFTFDSATQTDGLHIIGPPMKMIINKLFHHMCA